MTIKRFLTTGFPGRAGCRLLLLILAMGAVRLQGGEAAASYPRPNIILILADDMGYSDPGCFGGEVATPHLDRLAQEGMRFSRFYNGGMCVVSRASMLTGQWWPRALPHFKATTLLPEALKKGGYRTALIGKWHLQGHPLDRGFDHFFGFLGGFSDHFSGGADYRLDRAPFKDFGPNYYSSDEFADRAVQFIESGDGDEDRKPFFLYLSFQAPHNPLQAPREDIMKYRGSYLQGWQAVRKERFQRQKELGLIPPNGRLPAYPKNLPDWDSLTPAQQDLEDLRMSVFAAMIERMDRGIGRVVQALESSDQAENTFILFLSDNGADSFSVVDRAMLKRGLLPGDRGSNYQPGTGWAYASVTPWRLYKISQHGGGVTTGGIAWWPAGIHQHGRIESRPLHMIDVLPSLLEMSGLRPEPGALPGDSWMPLLRNEAWQRSGPLFFQYMDNRAIRTADWTLAEVDGSGWELFNTVADPLESKDLAQENTTLVAESAARWSRWWQEESGQSHYTPQSTSKSPHYSPQGDRGSGVLYQPSAMPSALSGRYPISIDPAEY